MPGSCASHRQPIRRQICRTGHGDQIVHCLRFQRRYGQPDPENQIRTVSGHADGAKAKGARVIAAGKARPGIGPLFYVPTVLTDVNDEMEYARHETFSPVVSIYPVDSVEEAIEKPMTPNRLNASVGAGSTAEGEAIARRLQAGNRQRGRGVRVGVRQQRRADGRNEGFQSRTSTWRRRHPEVHRVANRSTAWVLNLGPHLGIPSA